jgi:S1-C subfamily serine protease
MQVSSLFRSCAAGLVLLAGAAAASGAVVLSEKPAAVVADITAMVESKAPTIVSIKYILKGGEQDEEGETTGVVIDGERGLVLTSNNAFGGMMARFGGPSPTPSEIKILIGEDNNGLDAKFVARDSELGLAWVELSEKPAKALAAVDMTKSANVKLGDSLYVVSEMGKFFDRASSVAEGQVSAITKKPRDLVIPSIGLAATEMGMPVFTASGEVVGVLTLILPEQEEMSGSPSQMRATMRGITGNMILPAAQVVEATKRALETAANPSAEPAKEDKPAEAKPADAAEPK